MKPIIVAIPSRFDDHLQPLLQSIRERGKHKIVVLNDGLACPPKDAIRCPRPFNFSRNVNLAFKRYRHHDFVLLNDDTKVITNNAFSSLRQIAYGNDIGLLSPKIRGHARNPYQKLQHPLPNTPYISKDMIAFVAVFIRADVIDKIGFMDERFQRYGWEDDDYCLRATLMGFKMGITDKVVIQHIHGSGNSFRRLYRGGYGPPNIHIFRRKWGFNNADTALRNLERLKARSRDVSIPIR